MPLRRYVISNRAAFGSSPPPPPPPGYTCGGVVFDGASDVHIAALTAADTAFLSFSIWFWLLGDAPSGWTPLFVVDPNNNYTPGAGFRDPAGNDIFADNADYSVGINLNGGPTQYGATASWHNWLYSASLVGTPSAKLLLDGADVTAENSLTGTDGVFSLNALAMYLAGDGGGSFTSMYMADPWISSEHLNLGDPAVIAKFISGGKPVDLGADGSTPTGTAPAIFLSIPHGGTPANFATNKGTGGNFTITGALTLAPSSPSD